MKRLVALFIIGTFFDMQAPPKKSSVKDRAKKARQDNQQAKAEEVIGLLQQLQACMQKEFGILDQKCSSLEKNLSGLQQEVNQFEQAILEKNNPRVLPDTRG